MNLFQSSVKLVSKTREGSKVYRKYDQAQTPYQRISADGTMVSSAKQKLVERYQSLDPLNLRSQILPLQELLWKHADLRSLRPPKPPPSELGTLFKPHEHDSMAEHPIVDSKLLPQERFYQRTKRKITHSNSHYWRTRKDPFANV